MKFINFAKEQLEENISFLKDNSLFIDFISEYIRLCDKEEDFEKRLDEGFHSLEKKNTLKNINKIISNLEEIELKTINYVGKIIIPEVIIFAGPSGWDGHGIIIKDKTFLFLNITRFNPIMNEKGYHIKTHLSHELIHAIHYSYSPEFYPPNFKSVKEYFLNKMYSEGLATCLSQRINRVREKTALSFGLMGNRDFQKWKAICEDLKKDLWSSIEKCIGTEKKDIDLWNKLFSVPDLEPGCLMRGRFGYYYGLKIIKAIKKREGDKKLLHLKENEIWEGSKNYFLLH